MKSLLRPYKYFGMSLLVAAAGITTAPPGALGQFTQIKQLIQDMNPLLSHSSSPGYLGVLFGDIDNDAATRLKLKDTHGAVITLIDHDAPAGQVGLKVNDVVLSVNGQGIESAEQFGKLLREIPAGHKVTLAISREGSTQSVVVQLVNRKVMEHDVWNKINQPDSFPPPPAAMGLLPEGGDAGSMPGFHMPFFGSSLKVGALVEPLSSQMADYMGISSGIMVKQVTRKSEAATAGLRSWDVILKVGGDSIKTTADWDRALRANEGKPVQVTILRDRKQQVVNLQVDSKHHS